MSTPQETLEELLTVTSSNSDRVHLAPVLHDVVASQTLCHLAVISRMPVQRFQAAGCVACAEESLQHGIKAAVEEGHAAVNLERFLRRVRLLPEIQAPRIPRQPTG
jgi:superfamily II helicase